jgi:cytochrome c oxidase subunit 2
MGGLILHPPEASTLAPQVDLLFYTLLAFSLALGTFLVFLVVRYCVLYRRGADTDRSGPRARHIAIEIGWTSASAIVALAIFVWGADLFLERDNPPANAIEIQGFGKQWMWKFEHANGKREINELHVPVGRPVIVRLGAEDVIHSLFIPAFRIKQDAVPGMATSVWFEATETGTYDLFCAEYCGTEHSKMRGHVVVMSAPDFASWLASSPSGQTLAGEGAVLFRSYGCSGCHGPNSSVRAPHLEGVFGHPVALADKRTVMADEAYIRDSILNPTRDVAAGYDPIMPSFKDLIAEDDLMRLIAYVKSLGTEQEASP